ncbi:phosphocholine-specific phospholipase C [Acetobacter oeni]|uniref:phosphocholine-specific phospholipase C n=1 Tax=Acetobacter oeni TaxID=304077 RepID=UPI0035710E88
MVTIFRTGRRGFLKSTAAVTGAALMPQNIRKALSIPPRRVSGTIKDVEHVVILMQENRSFDHYFGCLGGVRGYGDPRAWTLPDGAPVFSQPKGRGRRVLPFRMNTVHTSAACLASLDHSWKASQAEWNEWDIWISRKTPMTMGHFTRDDIPYYYALADAFTICDAYHASIFGPTNPNRLFLFTGTSGLGAGHADNQVIVNVDDGNSSADISLDNSAFAPFRWQTYPECLQEAGVSWKLYQEYDNFTDNPLQSFAPFRGVSRSSWQYQSARRIVPGSTRENATTSEGRFLIRAFEKDVAGGTLPQVSWIVPSQAISEHPDAPPGYGETLISRLMDVFVRHPDTWAKTVFILNYDENDGFFDHMPAPVPALTPETGNCSVSTDGESWHGVPVGLGPRVPAIIISPWTKGGWVNSQLFDHTSVLRFLETRFGVTAPNITPWRRAVCGDLTTVFDFTRNDPGWEVTLPDTESYLTQTRQSCSLPAPALPARQVMPRQEAGQRRARAIPYTLEANVSNGHILLANRGGQGAVLTFTVCGSPTCHYTLGQGTAVDVPVEMTAGASVVIHGPDGFYRAFAGRSAPDVSLSLRPETGEVALTIINTKRHQIRCVVKNAYESNMLRNFVVNPSQTVEQIWTVSNADHWYDLTLTDRTHPDTHLHFAGHMQTGQPSRSDPHISRINA